MGTSIANCGCLPANRKEKMDRDELERALTQLDQAETCVFRLVELEPDLIRQPEILDVLTHLKSAIDSLRAAGRNANTAASTPGRAGAPDRGRIG